MVFELWEYENGHTFLERHPDAEVHQRRLSELVEHNAQHVWTVEAASYNEAMQLLYDRKGWGHYRTIEEELGENE
jgi:hypothetical protein